MSSGKASMTKKIKWLENALTDFKELDLMDLPNKDMQEAAREVDECRSAVKEAENNSEIDPKIKTEEAEKNFETDTKMKTENSADV